MAEQAKNPIVTMATSVGSFRIELDAEKAPVTTKNFLDYVGDGHFDGMIFHRVIPGFMIQGGGFDPKMSQKKTKAPIKNEAANGLKNVTGFDLHKLHIGAFGSLGVLLEANFKLRPKPEISQ